ncbi:MAG: hypothetical protein WCP20_17645 [Desulfuromonadales bacterium]
MPSFGAEESCVQYPLICYVTESEIGWTFISKEAALERRGRQEGSFFYDLLGDKLLALNRGILDKDTTVRTVPYTAVHVKC